MLGFMLVFIFIAIFYMLSTISIEVTNKNVVYYKSSFAMVFIKKQLEEHVVNEDEKIMNLTFNVNINKKG